MYYPLYLGGKKACFCSNSGKCCIIVLAIKQATMGCIHRSYGIRGILHRMELLFNNMRKVRKMLHYDSSKIRCVQQLQYMDLTQKYFFFLYFIASTVIENPYPWITLWMDKAHFYLDDIPITVGSRHRNSLTLSTKYYCFQSKSVSPVALMSVS